jgi:hypothetical protein
LLHNESGVLALGCDVSTVRTDGPRYNPCSQRFHAWLCAVAFTAAIRPKRRWRQVRYLLRHLDIRSYDKAVAVKDPEEAPAGV